MAWSSAERADGGLKRAPGCIPELLLPFLIEAGRLELVAECGVVDRVELHSFRSQLLLQGVVEGCNIGALGDAGRIDMLCNDRLNVLRQLVPIALVRQEPEAVPHMI